MSDLIDRLKAIGLFFGGAATGVILMAVLSAILPLYDYETEMQLRLLRSRLDLAQAENGVLRRMANATEQCLQVQEIQDVHIAALVDAYKHCENLLPPKLRSREW